MTNGTSLFASYPEADTNLRTEEAISTTVKNTWKSSVFLTLYFLVSSCHFHTGSRGEIHSSIGTFSAPGTQFHLPHVLRYQDEQLPCGTFTDSSDWRYLPRVRQGPVRLHTSVCSPRFCAFQTSTECPTPIVMSKQGLQAQVLANMCRRKEMTASLNFQIIATQLTWSSTPVSSLAL